MPSDLCKHYRDWVLPPADDTLGGVQLRSPHHLETFKLVSPRQHTTTFCCTKTKNTTFSNVIMLLCVSLKLVRSHLFSLRRGGNYICICVSLCVVLSCLKLIWFLSFLGGGAVFVVGASWEGGWSEDCHIAPVIWLCALEHLFHEKVCPPPPPPFTHPLIPSGKNPQLYCFFSSMANWARASLSPLLPKKEAALGVVKLLKRV